MSSMSSGRQGTCCSLFLMQAKSHDVKGVSGMTRAEHTGNLIAYRHRVSMCRSPPRRAFLSKRAVAYFRKGYAKWETLVTISWRLPKSFSVAKSDEAEN